MKELTLFHMRGCPYCAMARRALDELAAEDPRYGAVPVRWIDERAEAALAARYDYYYVPAVYAGETKLYEADPSQDYASIRESLRGALDAALAG